MVRAAGFIVAVPTRVGYGVTGGEDVEDSGPCDRTDYPPAYATGADETLAVLEAVRQRSNVSTDRAIVMGQSFGGTIAVAIAAMKVSGVQATINFAGGGGIPGRARGPVRATAVEAAVRRLQQTARIPTLWIYTENDRYMGAKLPKVWF